jgi:prevent-host-death family protein
VSQRITASQFKARCLALMDQVVATGEVLLITKNGRPVAELHPCAATRRPSLWAVSRWATSRRCDQPHRDKLVCSAVILPLAPPAEA